MCVNGRLLILKDKLWQHWNVYIYIYQAFKGSIISSTLSQIFNLHSQRGINIWYIFTQSDNSNDGRLQRVLTVAFLFCGVCHRSHYHPDQDMPWCLPPYQPWYQHRPQSAISSSRWYSNVMLIPMVWLWCKSMSHSLL